MRLVQANLVTKTDFDAKLSSFNRKSTKNKTDHLLVKNELSTLENKIPDISNLVKKTDYNTKIVEIDGKFDKIKQGVLDSLISLSVGNLLFDGGGGTQAYLIFQPVYKYFKFISNTNYISSWKSKWLSGEIIKPFLTSDNSLTPLIEYYNVYHIRVKFNGSILRQPKVTYTHKKW